MPSFLKIPAQPVAIALGLIALAGCSSDDARTPPAPVSAAPAAVGVPDTPVRLGATYTVRGQQFTPVDQADYDEVGYASWYGEELAGRPTANGEAFAPDWISAAHRTLPMPSYLEVTRLDTGRTILVRVNDRGPGDTRRLIDLSAGAARQLGIAAAGTVAVRVRRVNPVEAERQALRSGRAVPERLPTPESLLAILRERAERLPVPSAAVRPTAMPAAVPTAPGGATAPATAPAALGSGPFVVQIAAFSNRARADELARRLSATVAASGSVFRVRYGPFATEAEARSAQAQARQRGYPGAVILRDR